MGKVIRDPYEPGTLMGQAPAIRVPDGIKLELRTVEMVNALPPSFPICPTLPGTRALFACLLVVWYGLGAKVKRFSI